MIFGRLIVVPNALDLGTSPIPIEEALPANVLRRAAGIRHWVVEDAKSARAFLKRADAVFPLARPMQEIDIRTIPRPRKGTSPRPSDGAVEAALGELLRPLRDGQDVGMLSEAGLPGVADPGAALVAAAHANGDLVEVLAGASSITLALAASGLNGQRFAFEGYLPQDATARAQRVRELESRSRREAQTQAAIETPYRNAALLSALVTVLRPDTRLAVVCGLTLPGGWCRMARVGEWLREPLPEALLPSVFLWQAG